MVTRTLPREEWSRLKDTEAEHLWPTIPEGGGEILVVEDEGQIVGCWVLLQVVHAECVWIHPDHRGSPAIAKRLLVGMKRLAQAQGVRSLVTGAVSESVKWILTKLGAVKVPGEQYVIAVDRLGK